MVRSYGPITGAGTRVEEQEGNETIQPGALGWAGYGSLLEKGPVGELMLISGAALFARVCGGVIPDSLGPDAIQDYYKAANGTGGLALVRVTDGNERAASLTLYSRNSTTQQELGRIDAQNGGRWGGKAQIFSADLDAETDLAETTLQLPAAAVASYETNEWAGAYVELEGVPNARYEVIGNTTAGLVTVAADQTMRADLIAATAADPPTNLRFYLVLENEAKEVSILVDDGEESKAGEFSLAVLTDGAVVKTFGNLSTDPASARYWETVINDAGDNYEITAVNTFVGTQTPSIRPASAFAKVAAVAANVLTAEISDFTVASPGGGDPTFSLGTTAEAMVPQQFVITMTAATTGTVVSSVFGAIGTVTLATEFDSPGGIGGVSGTNKFIPPFTLTAGGSPLAAADVLTVNYRPLAPGLANGKVYPNKGDSAQLAYRIVSNTHLTISVSASVDLTADTAIAKDFMVSAPIALTNGRDGNADVLDAHYNAQAWDVDSSPFRETRGKNLGLIKFGTPGVTSTAVQQAGRVYADAHNHQYRYEVPANITGDVQALEYLNDTLGRSDYAKVNFPSYAYVPDPNPDAAREGRLKLVSLTGKLHGREARTAADNLGFQKVAAGVDATLDGVVKLTTGDRLLNEELLNPAGINVVKKIQGNFVAWGARILSTSSEWRYAQKRELMSYYENVFIESFDFILFQINDAASDALARTAFIEFFRPEFQKRAISGDQLIGGKRPALILKVDEELNTDAVRDAGNKIAAVSLRLANTTERFIIRIGQQGVFSAVA